MEDVEDKEIVFDKESDKQAKASEAPFKDYIKESDSNLSENE